MKGVEVTPFPEPPVTGGVIFKVLVLVCLAEKPGRERGCMMVMRGRVWKERMMGN